MDYHFNIGLLVFSLTILSPCALQADDDEEARQAEREGQVALPKATIAMSGIKTVTVRRSAYAEEYEAVGKVIGTEPLLALRSRYQVMLAEYKSANARLQQVKLSLHRQQQLYHDGISAKRSLQELTTQQFTEQAALDAARVRMAETANSARLQWGNKLGDWIVADDITHLKPLLANQQVLLQITVPGDKPYLENQGAIMIEPYGLRDRARPATFLSRTSQTDTTLQGESYYFVCDGRHLRAGMKITAWLKQPGTMATGVMVPQSALIWHLGQTFVYLKTGERQFTRRAIRQFTPAGGQYVVQNGLRDGDEVVSVGGQMLLSEEMRRSIPDED